MPNRSYLIRTNAADVAAVVPPLPDEAILVTGSLIVPVFWFALFTTTSRYERILKDDNGASFHYPVLLSETHAAVERAASKAKPLFSRLPIAYSGLFHSFLNAVALDHRSHIMLDGIELWSMGTPQDYDNLLNQGLMSFSGRDVSTSDTAWKSTLQQAQIRDVHAIQAYQLAGSGWLNPMPWEI